MVYDTTGHLSFKVQVVETRWTSSRMSFIRYPVASNLVAEIYDRFCQFINLLRGHSLHWAIPLLLYSGGMCNHVLQHRSFI